MSNIIYKLAYLLQIIVMMIKLSQLLWGFSFWNKTSWLFVMTDTKERVRDHARKVVCFVPFFFKSEYSHNLVGLL